MYTWEKKSNISADFTIIIYSNGASDSYTPRKYSDPQPMFTTQIKSEAYAKPLLRHKTKILLDRS